MKQSPRSRGVLPLPLLLLIIIIFFFFFLIHTSRASRDLSKPTQIKAVKAADSFSQMATLQGKVEREDLTLDILMGMEECEDGNNEECLKRRMISEAHLDYIYTQRHNKP